MHHPASSADHYFALHGIGVHLRCPEVDLCRLIEDGFSYKGAQRVDALDEIHIVLDLAREGELAVPEDALPLDSLDMDVEVFRMDHAYYFRREAMVMRLDPDAVAAEVRYGAAFDATPDTFESALAFFFVNIALVVLLRSHRYFALHAAALEHGGRGLLLTAPSGNGKTTAAVNLMRAGWRYASDDTVLLHETDSTVEVLSFRRDVSVTPDTARIWPELADHEWPPPPGFKPKWRVDIERMLPGQFTPRIVPRLIVMPQLGEGAESRLEPMPAREVLWHLILQSGLFLTPEPDVTRILMDTLRRLMQQCRTYRLIACADLLDAPGRTAELLAEALHTPTGAAGG